MVANRKTARTEAAWQQLSSVPAAMQCASELLIIAGGLGDPVDYLNQALPHLRKYFDADAVVLAAVDRGVWSPVASDGDASVGSATVPLDLLGEVLDSQQPQVAGNWSATLITADDSTQEVLAISGVTSDVLGELSGLAVALEEGLLTVRLVQQQGRRVRRLETILQISSEWNRSREMEPLLVQMAEAATSLLAADRASIFLWDKPNKMLVGRPALGVEGGELRIAEDVGVVGEVILTGETRRVDRTHDPDSIDRQVDEKLGYQTDNLICVPLQGSNGDRFGAFEVINKLDGNFTLEDESGLIELAAHAATALENTQELQQLVSRHEVMVEQAAEGARMIGQCPAIEALRSTVTRVADTELAVLVLGENGTGKEIVSQMVHYQSARRQEPLVAVNCAAIPDNLLESELFGHEKGSFTDAHDTRVGKFEQAANGTIFLDEIGDLSLSGQSKLLRVLEQKVVVRVGGSSPIPTDARVIAATNQDLATMVQEKTFRQDLFFRLNVVTLDLPPLRDRGDDVILLAEHFLNDFCVRAGRRPPKLSAAARKRLRAHAWPGNVRELRNVAERLAFLTSGDRIEEDDLAFNVLPAQSGGSLVPDDLTLTDATAHFQEDYIRRAVERSGGNMSDAATRLGLHRSNLYRKLRQLGIEEV